MLPCLIGFKNTRTVPSRNITFLSHVPDVVVPKNLTVVVLTGDPERDQQIIQFHTPEGFYYEEDEDEDKIGRLIDANTRRYLEAFLFINPSVIKTYAQFSKIIENSNWLVLFYGKTDADHENYIFSREIHNILNILKLRGAFYRLAVTPEENALAINKQEDQALALKDSLDISYPHLIILANQLRERKGMDSAKVSLSAENPVVIFGDVVAVDAKKVEQREVFNQEVDELLNTYRPNRPKATAAAASGAEVVDTDPMIGVGRARTPVFVPDPTRRKSRPGLFRGVRGVRVASAASAAPAEVAPVAVVEAEHDADVSGQSAKHGCCTLS